MLGGEHRAILSPHRITEDRGLKKAIYELVLCQRKFRLGPYPIEDENAKLGVEIRFADDRRLTLKTSLEKGMHILEAPCGYRCQKQDTDFFDVSNLEERLFENTCGVGIKKT